MSILDLEYVGVDLKITRNLYNLLTTQQYNVVTSLFSCVTDIVRGFCT